MYLEIPSSNKKLNNIQSYIGSTEALELLKEAKGGMNRYKQYYTRKTGKRYPKGYEQHNIFEGDNGALTIFTILSGKMERLMAIFFYTVPN